MTEKNRFLPRTDMAEEAHRLWTGSSENKSELKGVIARNSNLYGYELSEIHILDEDGEKALGKTRGKYFSLSLPERFDRSSEGFSHCVKAIAELIKKCCPDLSGPVLVGALGNPDITPDALGSLAASFILVSAHLDLSEFPQFKSLALCRPGVLGTSGMESSAQIKALCELTRAKAAIIIDALAGSDAERLCRCIQVSDAGISPGSGVGNNRMEINQNILGIPVISIGMPTVIDAGYLGGDLFGEMFVTPRSIDTVIRNAARIIAYAINLAVHSGISIEDMDYLLN